MIEKRSFEKFDLTIKNVDLFTVQNIPVLVDLLQIDLPRGMYSNHEEYGKALHDLLERCSYHLDDMAEDEHLPQTRKDFLGAVSKALLESSKKIAVAFNNWDEAVKELSKD